MPEIERKRAREKHPGSEIELKEEPISKAPEEVTEAIVPVAEVEVEEIKEEEAVVEDISRGIVVSKTEWKPKTEFGRLVQADKITNIDQILSSSKPILEPEIVDKLLPNMETVLLNIGQSKGKFGGGKRSIWRQTQKKTMEGNKPKFATFVVIGNRNGYVGVGYGKSKETMPAREKAVKNSKLNLISIKRGCGSWACGCKETHTIPFEVEGRCGSVRVLLKPAPKGTGLISESEIKKILELAGIKDIYSKAYGQARTKINLVKACFEALKKLSTTKVKQEFVEKLGIKEGQI